MTGPGCRISWYSRCSVTVPLPSSSTSTAVRGARRLPVDAHAKPHGRPRRGRAHDQVKIAGVEAVHDLPPAWFSTTACSPIVQSPAERPLIEPQPRRGGIDCGSSGRHLGEAKFSVALVAEVVLRRLQAVPIGGRFEPVAFDRHQVLADARLPRPRPAAAGSPAPTPRSRPRRTGGAGCARWRRRSRGPASSGCRRRARSRSRCRSRPDSRPAGPWTARRTLSRSCSKPNSGVCTPITTSPWSLYFSAQART